MIDIKLANEIIKQRALGLSYDDVTTVTGVSKTTVIKVCRERIDDIADAKSIASSVARADIAASINKRRMQYAKLVNRGIDELLHRDLSTMNTGELLRIIHGTERALATLEANDKTQDKPDLEWYPMDVRQAMAVLDRID